MIDPDAVKNLVAACNDAAAATDPAVYMASYKAGVEACAIVSSLVAFIVGAVAWSMRS